MKEVKTQIDVGILDWLVFETLRLCSQKVTSEAKVQITFTFMGYTDGRQAHMLISAHNQHPCLQIGKSSGTLKTIWTFLELVARRTEGSHLMDARTGSCGVRGLIDDAGRSACDKSLLTLTEPLVGPCSSVHAVLDLFNIRKILGCHARFSWLGVCQVKLDELPMHGGKSCV